MERVGGRPVKRIRPCYLRQLQHDSVHRVDQPLASWMYLQMMGRIIGCGSVTQGLMSAFVVIALTVHGVG